MQTQQPDYHRLGRFSLPRLESSDWERFIPLMSQMVVVQAEFHYDRDRIHYLAFSPLFDEIERFSRAPEYLVEFKREQREDSSFQLTSGFIIERIP